MNEEKLRFDNSRTEEVQSIIERMPTKFGFFVSSIVLVIFILIFVFGFIIRYPDIVTGQISVNTSVSPLKLVSNGNGKLKLNIRSMQTVKEGQIIAFIENATNPSNVIYIDSLLKTFNPSADFDVTVLDKKFPKNFSIGELNLKYYSFTKSLQELVNHKKDRLLDKQGENLLLLLNEQKNAIKTANKRVEMAKNTLDYAHKFFSRDSILFIKKVISESEFDKSQINYLSGKDGHQSAINNLINSKQAAQQTESKIQELNIQKPEKEKDLHIALISAYNELLDNIKTWEQKYVFRSPFTGKVQFLKFYTENQFVQAGEQVFSIIPSQGKVFGQVTLPSQGSGKIKIGQEVIVKLDNYPYKEYGSLTGRIESISLTTNVTKSGTNDVDTYMLLVSFPNQLKTNYGTRLAFKAEAKGLAEIITDDRRLIERLFDNLKYVVNK